MKNFWLFTTLLIGGLLLTWCDTNEQKTIEQNSSILTWGFSVKQDIEEVISEEVENYLENENNKNQDMSTEIIVPRTPNVDVITIHTWCSNYINDEFWFQINLDKWSSDCKIEYEQRYDWNNNIIWKVIKLWALPLNDYWWFESRWDFEQINIVSHNEELDEYELGYLSYLTENNKYKFYCVWWDASPSFYYTYFPLGYNDFICEWAHKDNDWNLVDNNWCYCSEDNSYWKSINIDMPNPARNIWCVTQTLIRESFSVFDI